MGGCQQVAAVIAIRGPQNMQMLRAFYKKGGFPNTALSSESIFSGLLKPKNSLQAVAHQERMKEWKIDWIYIGSTFMISGEPSFWGYQVTARTHSLCG